MIKSTIAATVVPQTDDNVMPKTITSPIISKAIITQDKIQYTSEVRAALLGGREIRVENLTPVLSDKERAERKRDIESRLFDVFIKYAGKTDTQE